VLHQVGVPEDLPPVWVESIMDIVENITLEGSYRKDGASVFGPDMRWGDFKGASASWIFSEEAFITNALPFLSLGVSGQVGEKLEMPKQVAILDTWAPLLPGLTMVDTEEKLLKISVTHSCNGKLPNKPISVST
jgi:hypothetical protein